MITWQRNRENNGYYGHLSSVRSTNFCRTPNIAHQTDGGTEDEHWSRQFRSSLSSLKHLLFCGNNFSLEVVPNSLTKNIWMTFLISKLEICMSSIRKKLLPGQRILFLNVKRGYNIMWKQDILNNTVDNNYPRVKERLSALPLQSIEYILEQWSRISACRDTFSWITGFPSLFQRNGAVKNADNRQAENHRFSILRACGERPTRHSRFPWIYSEKIWIRFLEHKKNVSMSI